MQSDDELQTTLSKWPFILGDVFLVATALAIAFFGDWQLTNWQVASCVISVALGCGLFALPYVVEFQVRIREEAEDRTADLRILQRHFVSAEAQLEAVSERVENIEDALADIQNSKSDTEAIEPEEVVALEPKAKKTREPRKRRTVEPRLIHRAIEQKQDKSSEAVSRIIESKSKKRPTVVEESPEEGKQKALIPEPTPEVVPEPPQAQAEERSATDEIEVEAPKEAVFKTPEPEEPEDKAPEPEDMFADSVPPQAKKRLRTKKSDTALVASVFIGIGNKPFVRGSGAGLNWACGVAMEFEEIGKWRWLAPADMEAPVEIQLFRNDEDADTTGKYTLEPGQKLELSPVF